MDIDLKEIRAEVIFPPKQEAVELTSERKNYLMGFYAGRFQEKGYQPYFPDVFKKLTGHCAFKNEELNRKGICLIGGVGNGKTMAMEIISKLFNIDLHHSIEIASFYKKYEEFPEPSMIFTDRSKWGRDLIIDDMGAEKTIVNFGERTEVLNDFLQQRYMDFKHKKAMTYISTNLSKQSFIERYSDRIWSRIEEMCLVVDMTNCRDLRKEL